MTSNSSKLLQLGAPLVKPGLHNEPYFDALPGLTPFDFLRVLKFKFDVEENSGLKLAPIVVWRSFKGSDKSAIGTIKGLSGGGMYWLIV